MFFIINLDRHLDILKKYTIEKKHEHIFSYLNDIDRFSKGAIFSHYLALLYEGNGIACEVVDRTGDGGADILLFPDSLKKTPYLIVQAKNHANRLTKKEILSEIVQFETEASQMYNCNNYKLVSLNGFVRDGNDFIGKSRVALEDWKEISELISNFSSDCNPEKPYINLFEHNLNTYRQATELLNKHNKVAILQATGTGKSSVAQKIILDYSNYTKLFISPTRNINRQFKRKTLWATNLTCITYASLGKYLKNTRLPSNTLIILDEFHRCGATKWGESVRKLFSNNENHKIIGLTATPIRSSDKRDMAKELFDDIKTTNLNVFDAIARGILPEPIYVTAMYTLDAETAILENNLKQSDFTEYEQQIILNDIRKFNLNWRKSNNVPAMLKKYVTKEYNKLLVFCRTNEEIDYIEGRLYEWFRDLKIYDSIEFSRVTSKDLTKSKNALNDFEKKNDKNTLKILFAIDMLNEGIHIKDVSMVMFLRDTKSERIFYQQFGRVLEAGKTVKPIVFDMVNNFNEINKVTFSSEVNRKRKEYIKAREEIGIESKSKIDCNFSIHDETKELHTEFYANYDLAVKNILANRKNNGNKRCLVAGHEVSLPTDNNQDVSLKSYFDNPYENKDAFIIKESKIEELLNYLDMDVVSLEKRYIKVFEAFYDANVRIADYINKEKIDFVSAFKNTILFSCVISSAFRELKNILNKNDYGRAEWTAHNIRYQHEELMYMYMDYLNYLCDKLDTYWANYLFSPFANIDSFVYVFSEQSLILPKDNIVNYVKNKALELNEVLILNDNSILESFIEGFDNVILCNNKISELYNLLKNINNDMANEIASTAESCNLVAQIEIQSNRNLFKKLYEDYYRNRYCTNFYFGYLDIRSDLCDKITNLLKLLSNEENTNLNANYVELSDLILQLVTDKKKSEFYESYSILTHDNCNNINESLDINNIHLKFLPDTTISSSEKFINEPLKEDIKDNDIREMDIESTDNFSSHSYKESRVSMGIIIKKLFSFYKKSKSA